MVYVKKAFTNICSRSIITHMNKKDVTLCVVLVVIALCFVLMRHMSARAETAYVYVDGSLYGKYDLSSDNSIRITNDNGIVNDIEISDGSIFMKDATCPGKQCVRTGHISRNNETITCAPAGILIIVPGIKLVSFK